MKELDEVFDEFNSKEKAFWEILNSAVSLDIANGHLNWSITNLAQESRVSRGLIYHYFGKSKANILLEAINFFNRYILGTNAKQLQLWEKRNILPSLELARDVLGRIPAIVPFYFINRDLDNAIGDELREQRKIYFSKLISFFPFLSPLQIQTVHSLLFGLVFYPDLAQSALEEGVKRVIEIIHHYEKTTHT